MNGGVQKPRRYRPGTVAMRKIRGFVSLNKKRYQVDGFDLDLSYITPQLIAMGIPSTGVEAVYRNPMDEAKAFWDWMTELGECAPQWEMLSYDNGWFGSVVLRAVGVPCR